MSYNSNTKTITANVSEYDVQQALNTTEKDLGKLCTNENINKWAVFKPIKRAIISPIDVSANLRAYCIEGEEFCGLKGLSWSGKSFSTFISEMISHFNSDDDYYNAGVKYVKPTGDISSPYRLSDFTLNSNEPAIKLGYKHNAHLIETYTANNIIHTINCWSRARDAEPYNQELGTEDIILDYQPEGYSENWDGYNGISFLTKRISNLTEEDENIRLHDLIYSQWSGITSVSNLKHGILLHDPDRSLVWVFVNRIPLDDITSSRTSEVKQAIAEMRNALSIYIADNNNILNCVDFLTDAPETAGTTTSDVFFDATKTGSYNFVVIPTYIGYKFFKAASNVRTAQITPVDDALFCDGTNFIYNVMNAGQKVNQGEGYLWSFILNKCDNGVEPEAWLVGRKYNPETQTYSEDKIHHTVYNYDNNGTGTSEANSLIVGNMYSMFLKDYKNSDTGEYFYDDVKIAIYGYANSTAANKTEICSSDYAPLNN